MSWKIIAVLSAMILVLIVSLFALGAVLKAKNKKIKLLSESIERQKKIVETTGALRKKAESEKKKLASGTNEDKFSASVDALKKIKKEHDK